MPILITEDYKYTRDYFHEHLEKNGIFSRKYFHPLITDLSLYKSSIDEIKEFNIGHFLIGECIFVGFANSIKQFKKIIKY